MTPELIWIVLAICRSPNFLYENHDVYRSSSSAVRTAEYYRDYLECEKVEIYPAFAPVSVGTGAVVLPTACELIGHKEGTNGVYFYINFKAYSECVRCKKMFSVPAMDREPR